MPFKSQAQRRFMYAKHPAIAKEFEAHTPSGKLPEHVDNGFFGHGTHESMQAEEDSICSIGDGSHDAYVPKLPTTDSFYDNVSNWHR